MNLREGYRSVHLDRSSTECGMLAVFASVVKQGEGLNHMLLRAPAQAAYTLPL